MWKRFFIDLDGDYDLVFQKNLVVWKRNFLCQSRNSFANVSEELSSVETNNISVVRI